MIYNPSFTVGLLKKALKASDSLLNNNQKTWWSIIESIHNVYSIIASEIQSHFKRAKKRHINDPFTIIGTSLIVKGARKSRFIPHKKWFGEKQIPR